MRADPCVCVCVRACVRARVRACVSACVCAMRACLRVCIWARAPPDVGLPAPSSACFVFVLLAESERHRLAVDGVHAGLRAAHLPGHVAAEQEGTAGVHGGGLPAQRAGCLA